LPTPGDTAVIFDLDGTLADSELAHERALLAAAQARGMTFSHEWFRDNCVGVGERGCFRMLAALHAVEMTDALLAELVALKLERFLAAVKEGQVPAYPGAVELVFGAAERARVAVCSGSSRESIGPVLGRLGLTGVLRAVVTSGDIALPKPDPEAYLLAAARLRVPPEQCVALEDSPTGIASAKAAGMRVVAVEHSFPRERLAGADEVVATIAGLSVEQLLPTT
jgi:beta-phosphoglucomutase